MEIIKRMDIKDRKVYEKIKKYNAKDICKIVKDSKNIRNRINKLTDKSIKINKEIGGTFCIDDVNKVRLSKECIGTECSVIDPECEYGTKEIGTWHSHGKSTLVPSLYDYISAAQRGIDSVCISFRENNENKISCFNIPKDLKSCGIKTKKLIEQFYRSKSEEEAITLKNKADKRKVRFDKFIEHLDRNILEEFMITNANINIKCSYPLKGKITEKHEKIPFYRLKK